MDEQIRARLRLHLLSERALGLDSVELQGGVPLAVEETADEEPEPVAVEPDRRSAPWLPVRSPAQAPVQRDVVPTAADAGLLPIPADAPLAAVELAADEKVRRLGALDENEIRGCTKCRLCETRTRTVFGEGDASAKIFFIGEGPGETEDRTGRPFVGRAGELLDKMIAGMGLAREQVYIANVVKCRPPGNRVPAPDEVATCTPYLERQLEIVRPKVIVTLGLPAAQYMLQSKQSMGKLRGNWQTWRGIKLMPTYHPAYVLRNQTYETRAAVWSDLKQVMGEIGLAVQKKKP